MVGRTQLSREGRRPLAAGPGGHVWHARYGAHSRHGGATQDMKVTKRSGDDGSGRDSGDEGHGQHNEKLPPHLAPTLIQIAAMASFTSMLLD